VIGIVILSVSIVWAVEMSEKMETVRKYVPWIGNVADHPKWKGIAILVCWLFLSGYLFELWLKEIPEIPKPPTVEIKAPTGPTLNITHVNPPLKAQCWIKNYAVPVISAPPRWGMATIICNTSIKPPYSVELNYDQKVAVGPLTFPVGSEFAKSSEANNGTKIVVIVDLHTIIPNEPFSIMAQGSTDKLPLVNTVIIRAKGLVFELGH
jgi:hypothetical protein